LATSEATRYTYKMKKGQLLGQPLVFVFALIAGAMILAWGVNTVLKMGVTAGKVEIGEFAMSVQGKTSQYLNFDEGSSTTIAVKLPPKTTYVCFFDSSKDKNCMLDGKPCQMAQLDQGFAALANTKIQDNMFSLPISAYEGMGKKLIKDLKADTEAGNPLCFRNQAGNKITLRSMGTYVAVTQ